MAFSMLRVLLLLACLSGKVLADVQLPAVFSDHMVLQQGVTLPIWGRASPGEHVLVYLTGRSGEATADASGYWRVTLRPIRTSFTPDTLVVKGNNRIEINDVIIGDVWLCAGEGNMEFPLSQAASGKDSGDAVTDEGLRFFVSETSAAAEPKNRGSGKWVVCTEQTAAAFSAVGYFFARDIRSSQHLPVGMIQCSCGESPIEAWISLQGLSQAPSFTAHLAELARWKSSPEHSRDDPGGAFFDHQKRLSSELFNGMIAPLIPYAMTGVIWYQGESNEGASSLEYRRLFPRLISDWRKQWKQGPFPFYFVSLAGFEENDSCVEPFDNEEGKPLRAWPWIREGASCALTLPLTGEAVATDLGLKDDPQPPDKLDVARRLALLARHRVYGEQIVDSGPLYRGINMEGKKLRVEFDSVGSHLTLGMTPSQVDDGTPDLPTFLKGFAIAGEDHKWFPATGMIDENSILLTSDAVPHPVAVRYNWKGFPDGNLYNREGLPAAPFRSDDEQPH
jgi:sialate O-acetylesterase